MDQGSLIAPVLTGRTRSWKLKPPHDVRAQGLVASAFDHLGLTTALALRAPDDAGGGWLSNLLATVPITDADGRDEGRSAAVALSAAGLRAIYRSHDLPQGFSTQFLEGMHQEDRRRRLGDDPTMGAVIAGKLWGGADEPVHALLLIYGDDAGTHATEVAAAKAILAGHGIAIVRELALWLRYDGHGVAAEHFGFADGVSQPIPRGEAITPGGETDAQLALHGIAAGDVLLGQVNAHNEVAAGPLVSESAPCADLLPQADAAGFRDLGRDGSYLVVRELRQDVAAFWASMSEAAAELGPGFTADWVAARVIGRDRDGTILLPPGTVPAGAPSTWNDFRFLGPDPHGLTCPLGAHVRRANPRDTIAPSPDDADDLLRASNNHRIIRRGRKFGPRLADPAQDDGAERGLLFLALNTDIARQFEFIQQTWLLNPYFATLYGETDPLLGPRGPFTIPADPVRLRPSVQTFVRFAGGEYFFLPSMPALAYLGSLP